MKRKFFLLSRLANRSLTGHGQSDMANFPPMPFPISVPAVPHNLHFHISCWVLPLNGQRKACGILHTAVDQEMITWNGWFSCLCRCFMQQDGNMAILYLSPKIFIWETQPTWSPNKNSSLCACTSSFSCISVVWHCPSIPHTRQTHVQRYSSRDTAGAPAWTLLSCCWESPNGIRYSHC